MRRFTAIALAALLLILAAAAVGQLLLARSGRGPYPGPVPGTPLPPVTASP